jgi:hypothetical protein
MKEQLRTPQDYSYEVLVHLKLFQKQKFSPPKKAR